MRLGLLAFVGVVVVAAAGCTYWAQDRSPPNVDAVVRNERNETVDVAILFEKDGAVVLEDHRAVPPGAAVELGPYALNESGQYTVRVTGANLSAEESMHLSGASKGFSVFVREARIEIQRIG